jgi:hypothetical protein
MMHSLLILITAFGIAYLFDCAIWPYLFCLSCDGSKRHGSPVSRGFRICRTCGGKGTRRRFGKVLIDRFTSRRRR